MIYVLIFALIVLAKIIVFSVLISKPQVFFAGGNDGDYYDAYARGADLVTSSIWPDVLRALNEVGLYSREGVSIVMMVLGVVCIPLLVSYISSERGEIRDKKLLLQIPIIVSLYPTLFYYTLDIYRDVLMLFCFLAGLYIVKASVESRRLASRMIAGVLVVALSYVMFKLRGYLGFAFLISFVVFQFVRFERFKMFLHLIPMLIGLNVLFALGYLEPFMKYRALFDGLQGGSNLGIRFESVYSFLPDFLKNFYSQYLGLFFPNGSSILLFLMESVPFIIALLYLIKNRRFSTRLVDFIFVFSIIYSIIWLLGNDNLGTAARLRMCNYIGVLIGCAIVYQRKRFFASSSMSKSADVAKPGCAS